MIKFLGPNGFVTDPSATNPLPVSFTSGEVVQA